MLARQLCTLLLATFCCSHLIVANVIFRFAFDFHVKSGNDSQETSMDHQTAIDKTLEVENNRITIKDNLETGSVEVETSTGTGTVSDNGSGLEPVTNTEMHFDVATVAPQSKIMTDIWASQNNLGVRAEEKLHTTRAAILNLNKEITPLVGRSDFMAAKVKLTTRYLNLTGGEEAIDTNSIANKFEILRKFVKLVDKLREPPTADLGGERSMEFILMSLALDKYELMKLRNEIEVELTQAEEAWQKYVIEKLVEVLV